MDVDWSKTNQGRKYYNTQSAVDFAAAGISHVRIRIADKVDQELLEGLDRQIRDCLDNGIIPIIAYQADAFKNDPSDKNIENVVTWWSEVTEHYQDKSDTISSHNKMKSSQYYTDNYQYNSIRLSWVDATQLL